MWKINGNVASLLVVERDLDGLPNPQSRKRVEFHGRVKDTVVKLWPYRNWDKRSLQLQTSVAVR